MAENTNQAVDLEKENAQLKADLTVLNEKLAAAEAYAKSNLERSERAEAELKVAEEKVSTLESKLSKDKSSDRIAELEKANAEKDELITELQKQLVTDKLVSKNDGLPVFEKDGKQYAFRAKDFTFKGQKYEASEAVENKELIDELLRRNVGFIEKIETEE